jgi:hypothetical protein
VIAARLLLALVVLVGGCEIVAARPATDAVVAW